MNDLAAQHRQGLLVSQLNTVMGLSDKLDDILASFGPKSRGLGGGIGSGHGMVADDDVSIDHKLEGLKYVRR